MKVAIIGATAQSTPVLFSALKRSDSRHDIRFSLAGRNTQALSSVARAIKLLGDGEFQILCSNCSHAGLVSAFEDADVIVIQARYGGLAGRDFDETIPLAFGICGDEGLGPGGLSAAWRTWPELSALLGVVQAVSPDARVVLLTSPCSLLTRLAHLCWPDINVKALCELPMTTLEGVGGQVKAYDYFGVNHLGWIYNLPGQDPVPLKYWRLHTEASTVLAQQLGRGETRAAELARLSNAALRAFAEGTKQEIEMSLAARPAPWYVHALAPLLESLVTRRSGVHFFLSERNKGWNKDFREDDVLEIPYCWKDNELRRKDIGAPVPQAILAQLEPFVEYERAAATAVAGRSASALERALQSHPWVSLKSQAKGLAEVIVNQALH